MLPRRPPSTTMLAAALLLPATGALGDIDPLSGIDFVTVGAVGNPAWPGGVPAPIDLAAGRGSVGYEYRIGRFEVTTAQWVEFFNAAFDRPASDRLPFLIPPNFWGAVAASPTVPGGQRWSVPPGNAMRGVGNISWRMAAMYCNWLCNGKSTARSAFLNGAYDVSTFGSSPFFTDQPSHTPGARYWIPTLDEWIKAAHYDPGKNGPGQGGWWLYDITSDAKPRYGPPGTLVDGLPAQANAYYDGNLFAQTVIPLGAYAGVTSPWGLYDCAGGTSEWTEEIVTDTAGQKFRLLDGSDWGSGAMLPGRFGEDYLPNLGVEFPNISTYDYGLRIAASVPVPGLCFPVGVVMVGASRRRRPHAEDHRSCVRPAGAAGGAG